MDPKTAKRELVIIAVLFVAGFIFNYFAPQKFKLDGNEIVKLGLMSNVILANIVAAFGMGLAISGFYCGWKIIGVIWQKILQNSNSIWFVSPIWIIIGKIAKFIIAGQLATLIGLPIIVYSIYCFRKLKQAS